MWLQKERKTIIAYGKKMLSAGLTRETGGNLSIYDRNLELMAITPSGTPYEEIEPEDIMIMKLDGTIVEGNKTPSSEHAIHEIVYRTRKDVGAMLHVHSTFAVTLACLNEDLPAVDYMVAYARGRSVKCAPYASFGTADLAINALKTMGNQNAVLLANHGTNVVGPDLPKAFAIAEQLEFCAKLYVRARSIGTPIILPDDEMDHLVERFIRAGINDLKWKIHTINGLFIELRTDQA